MKRLKKGFTLIELLVVIAIIGILATTLAPKLREQLAKAKDAKAIAVLGAVRTVGEIVFMENLVNDRISAPALEVIYTKLDSKAQKIYEKPPKEVRPDSYLYIGGSGDGTKVTSYGGTIEIKAPEVSNDNLTINFMEYAATIDENKGGNRSSEGKRWNSY